MPRLPPTRNKCRVSASAAVAKLGTPTETLSKEPPTIIALDPSLTNFGIAVLDGEDKIIETLTLKPKDIRGLERVRYLIKGLKVCMSRHYSRPLHPPLLVREDYAFASHSSSDTMLKELGGILEWELSKLMFDLHRVGVAQVKKFVTGKGNAQKADMMLAIYKNFGVEPQNEHEADAIGVAFTARSLLTRQGKTAAQRQMIAAAVKNDHPLTKLTL